MSGNTRLVIMLIVLVVVIYYAIVSLLLILPTRGKRIVGIGLYIISVAFFVFSLWAVRSIPSWKNNIMQTIVSAYTMAFIGLHVVVALFFLIDDIRRLFLWIGRLVMPNKADVTVAGAQHISRSKFLTRLGWIGGITIFSTFFIGIKNRYNYQVRRVKLKTNKSNLALKGLKIIHISDIHTGSFDNEEAVLRGVKMINEEEPDLILFTGDIVNQETSEIVPYIPVLQQLKAKLGIYSTLGNHDYGDYRQWESKAAKEANLNQLISIQKDDLGWNLMMNEHTTIERNGDSFTLIGVENWGANMNFPKYGKLAEAYSGLENDPGYKILLSHDPSHWDHEIRPQFGDIDLTLSGHTHGMQFGIDLSWFKWSPSKYIYPQWAGLYQEGNQQIYVNRGYGFLGYKGRVGILPEITVIEFDV